MNRFHTQKIFSPEPVVAALDLYRLYKTVSIYFQYSLNN